MKIRSALSAAAVSLPLLAIACGSSGSGGPQPMMCYGASPVANEINDYSFMSTFSLPPVTVKSMSNLTFDWSAVTHDFLNHPVSATADLNTISVLIFKLPIANVPQKLNDDTLSTDDIYVIPPPSIMPSGGATSAMLYDLTLNGTAVDQATFDSYFDPSKLSPTMYSYMVAAASGTTIGSGFRMLQTFQVDPAASSTMVKLTNDSTKLSYHANLHSLTIMGVPGGTAAITLDWSDMVARMAKNGLGATFKDGYVTSAVVGHYKETPAELEAKFLDLNLIADKYYTADLVSSTAFDFTTLKEQTTGADFTGVDDNGTWLLGLICGNCRNPAPWYMTVLKPCTM
jgi:hypothetical protein